MTASEKMLDTDRMSWHDPHQPRRSMGRVHHPTFYVPVRLMRCGYLSTFSSARQGGGPF